MTRSKGGEPTCERIRYLREAAAIPRCHTFGSPDPTQTIALHTWNALNLLLVLHPEPSLDLVKAVQWHDAHERYTGDVPSPAKWANTKLREGLAELRVKVDKHFGTYVELGERDFLWLVCVDLLDLLLMAQERRHLGDFRFAQMVAEASAWFGTHKIPVQVARFLEAYVHGTRLLDTIPEDGTSRETRTS